MLFHEAERRHAEHQQQNKQRQRHHQSTQYVRPHRAPEPRSIGGQIHRHMSAGQNAREDGKLGAHRLQPLVNPRAFREHTDVHNHHEQRQRQHALAHKQRERTHHRARQQPLNTRDIRHIRHHGQGVERHGPLMQRLPQREHSNNSRHENHKKRHGLPLTFVAGPRAH